MGNWKPDFRYFSGNSVGKFKGGFWTTLVRKRIISCKKFSWHRCISDTFNSYFWVSIELNWNSPDNFHRPIQNTLKNVYYLSTYLSPTEGKGEILISLFLPPFCFCIYFSCKPHSKDAMTNEEKMMKQCVKQNTSTDTTATWCARNRHVSFEF